LGALRLYLALCVVVAHSSALPFPTHSGTEAVQIFFLISGFNMSLVRDRYPDTLSFLRSRFLRIYVPAWTVLGTVFCLSIASGHLRGHWQALEPWRDSLRVNGWPAAILAAISNVFLVGQDWLMFLAGKAGSGLWFCADFWQDPAPLHRLLLLPQMWSVAMEVVFYLMVPWLWRWNRRCLLLLVILPATARIVGYAFFGLGRDPWDNRFLPFEIGLFALGMLVQSIPGRTAYRLPRAFAPRTILLLCLFLAIAVVQSRVDRAIGAHWAALVFLPLWAWILPGLFAATRNCRADRILGDLSYPVYLVHILAVGLVARVETAWKAPIAIGISLLLAEALRRGIEGPLDRYRGRLRKVSGTIPTGPGD
jgi:peptidoglycan/LPS O-acetylase OafA/YrhL